VKKRKGCVVVHTSSHNLSANLRLVCPAAAGPGVREPGSRPPLPP
jgi:hypothetical protein